MAAAKAVAASAKARLAARPRSPPFSQRQAGPVHHGHEQQQGIVCKAALGIHHAGQGDAHERAYGQQGHGQAPLRANHQEREEDGKQHG